ncbi:MAG: tetratricopeptide repeat protein [Candidatus Eisenbacteria bacterium]
MKPVLSRLWLSFCGVLAATVAIAAESPRTLFERGEYRRAAEVCEQRLAAEARDVEANTVLSRVRGAQARLDDAIRLAEAAVAAAPRSADAQYALSEAYGRKAQSVGVLKAAGYAGKMRKAADAALAANPDHLDALEILVDFHMLAPGFMGGDKKKAAEFVERLARLDASRGWLEKAQNANRAKDTTLAAQCYDHAATLTPPDPLALVTCASYYAGRGRDLPRAEKLALQAVQLEPWRTGGWQVLASLYAYQERYSDLDDVLEKSLAAEPTHLSPWYQAGRQLVVSKKDPARAERYLRRYLSAEPEIGAQSWAAARWRLGQALELQGKKNEAIAEIESALKQDPKLEDAKKDLKRLRG